MTTWILGFEASTPRTVVALGTIEADGAVLRHGYEGEVGSDRASAELVPRAHALLRAAGIGPRDLRAIGCGRGPGTFTGTRVSVATAKGLAAGLDLPVVAVSTLEALGASITGPEPAPPVLAALDARRGEVYAALLQLELGPTPRVTTLTEELVAPLATVVERVRDLGAAEVVPVGPGIAAHPGALPPAWAERAQPMAGPTADGLWRALASAWAARRTTDALRLGATYLRRSYAELGIHQPKRPFRKSPFV